MGAVNTTYTFTATDTITSTKMNNIIDQTTITPDAIIGTTLDVASGKLKIRSAGITSNEMGTNSVTTNAITDLNVTNGKIADLAVTTGKLADFCVTTGKLADNSITTVNVLDANITPAKLSQPLTLATAQNSTSGTSVDFTSVPSWVKRITVALNGVSKNSTGSLLLQLGTSSGIETTGYSSCGTNFMGAISSTSGFIVADGNASWATIGTFTLVHMGSNLWICTYICSLGSASSTFFIGSGSKTLSAVLDRVRITTSSGTDTFDAGSINIMYE